MIPVEAHLARILAAARPLPTMRVPLEQARGLALAEPLRARWPMPRVDNSAMDGYAVRRADAVEGARLRVVADVPAGSSLDPPLAPGEAARIMTGAAVPTDADAIVPLEATGAGTEPRPTPPATITILDVPAEGAHIRRRGEDAEPGDLLIDVGATMGAWQLSSAASMGWPDIEVHRAPRVAVIATGSELVAPGAEPARGQVTESNSILLAAALRDAGCELASVERVGDDESALRAAVDRVDLGDADVLICTGGASVGAFDVAKAVLAGDGHARFDRVAMQPGKPQGFGALPRGALVFSLPGNPVSVAASFEVFVRPALRQLGGHAVIDRPRLILPALEPWRCPRGRMQVLPAVIEADGVRPATRGGSRSHLVGSLAAATALAIIPAAADRIEIGDLVSTMILP